MAYSASSSQLRRHYPRELDGAKNEWKALVDHYSEAGNKSDQVEINYMKTKSEIQRQGKCNSDLVLEHQQIEAALAKQRDKREVLDLERHIIDRDQELYNRERLKQLEEKNKKTSAFVSYNDALLQSKKAQQEKEVLVSW